MAYLKSAIYLAAFGGTGYILMKLITPDEKKILQDLSDHHSSAAKKRQAFVDVLRGAAEGREPMYRQTKEQIDATRDKFLSKKKSD